MHIDPISTQIVMTVVVMMVGLGLIFTLIKSRSVQPPVQYSDVSVGNTPSLNHRLSSALSVPSTPSKPPPSNLIANTPQNSLILGFRDNYYEHISECLENNQIVAETPDFKTYREDIIDILALDLLSDIMIVETMLYRLGSRDNIQEFIMARLGGSPLLDREMLCLNFRMTRLPADAICLFFPNLIFLSMPNAGITGGIEKLSRLQKLESLMVPNNVLRAMPDLSQFQALKEVNISGNFIRIENEPEHRNKGEEPILIY